KGEPTAAPPVRLGLHRRVAIRAAREIDGRCSERRFHGSTTYGVEQCGTWGRHRQGGPASDRIFRTCRIERDGPRPWPYIQIPSRQRVARANGQHVERGEHEDVSGTTLGG